MVKRIAFLKRKLGNQEPNYDGIAELGWKCGTSPHEEVAEAFNTDLLAFLEE